jgi:hypothetical protein
MTALAIRHYFKANSIEALRSYAIAKEFDATELSSKERGFWVERMVSLGIVFNCFGKPLNSMFARSEELKSMPEWLVYFLID